MLRGSQEREREVERILEWIRAENFQNLMKDINLHIWGAQSVSNRLNSKTHTPKYILVKLEMIKDRDRIFKAPSGKKISLYTWDSQQD